MRAIMVAVFLIVCIANPAYARGAYGSVAVAGWSGGAFTDDKTGKFSNCIASASYKSGINVGVLVSETYHWALGFTYPGWVLTPDQKFPIVLSFDGRNTFNVVGVDYGPRPNAGGLCSNSELLCCSHDVGVCST
jgi:hypothetical protein